MHSVNMMYVLHVLGPVVLLLLMNMMDHRSMYARAHNPSGPCHGTCRCYHRKGKKYTDCSFQGLQAVPANISMHTHTLYLNGNNISQLDSMSLGGGSYLSNLRVLHLNDNPYLTINSTDVFYNVRHIHTLLLHGTAITDIPDGLLSNLTRLKWLWLNDGAVTNIAPLAFRGKKLAKPET
jgi:Leucine-rich repeat (LRR) protein